MFNRPDTTRQVFEAVRAARPSRLYIAADGPRPHRAGEAERCQEVRRICSSIDWPCEVKTRYRETNLGCKRGVADGVSWFFAEEPEGIILEDDVLPLPTFFSFCDEMLERFRDDDRVAMVTGCNLISSHFRAEHSYFFSRYNHIWGWASWRRVWRHYDVDMRGWRSWRDSNGLSRWSGGDEFFSSYWNYTLSAAHAGNIDTWDYQWTFTCWRLGGLTVAPAVNQTSNLGFGSDATHTTAEAPQYVIDSPAVPLEFPLKHPDSVERSLRADRLIDEKVFGINFVTILKQRLFHRPLVRKVGRLARNVLRQGR